MNILCISAVLDTAARTDLLDDDVVAGCAQGLREQDFVAIRDI